MADRDSSSLETMGRKGLTEALGHFEAWMGRNPLEIKNLVIKAGGWRWIVWKLEEKEEKKLGFPKWAHLVRQFFNEEPKSLSRELDRDAERAIANALSSRALNSSKKNHIFAKLAYSGDVYKDLVRDKYGKLQWRKWIEQSQSGTMYHYEGGQRIANLPGGDIFHTALSAATTHNYTAAFKLCLPDGTGGSNEACFHNRGFSRSLGVAGKPIPAKEIAITNNKYRGSYNYADTMGIGYDLHEKFDVETDKKWGQDYVDERQFSPISGRIFRREHFRV